MEVITISSDRLQVALTLVQLARYWPAGGYALRPETPRKGGGELLMWTLAALRGELPKPDEKTGKRCSRCDKLSIRFHRVMNFQLCPRCVVAFMDEKTRLVEVTHPNG